MAIRRSQKIHASLFQDKGIEKLFKGEHSEFLAKIFRLAINTIAYMKVFPECVKEGVPKTEQSECAYTLGVSEKVIEPVATSESNRMLSPHFRKGYLKRLTSDFYTHKKGQVIFVSETMVNGVAKTVEKSKDEKKINDFSENGLCNRNIRFLQEPML